ncbi:MAG: phosphotransferase [Pseudomonadota bacterium]
MTQRQLAEAARAWGFSHDACRLFARRENLIFRVELPERTLALRIHRAGYTPLADLRSEHMWLRHLAGVEQRGRLQVPQPIKTLTDDDLLVIDGVTVDCISWLPGEPLSASLLAYREGELSAAALAKLFSRLGRALAALHVYSDRWRPPPAFSRRSWDAQGLVGAEPAWGRFWEHPQLTDVERALLRALRDAGRTDLAARTPDYGLIHADAVADNVLVHRGEVALIDFDDAGYGYRGFDVATALLKHRHLPVYGELRAALLDGYRSVTAIDTESLELLFALRAASYVGWIASRLEEPGARERSARYIAQACEEARRLLD